MKILTYETRHAFLTWAVAATTLVTIAILLSACAGVAPVVTKPVEVLVPGPQTPCTPKLVPVPAWATDAVAPTASFPDRALALGVELLQRAAYEVDLKAALDGCVTPPSGSAAATTAAPGPAVPKSASPTLTERFKSLFHRGP